eukprot:GDKI01035455.1.p2 GENE.GDKI01035455.1~~GDKI01035455.1.p2  ORF type:complete len:115 (-),score=36.62 GDKI01035455.1:194-538(-)
MQAQRERLAKEQEDKLVEQFEFVKLISSEGHEFLVDKPIAMQCETIRVMCESGFQEGKTQEIPFPTITGKVLEKVVEYLYWRYKHTDSRTDPPDLPIDDDIVLELLLVANYLNI